MGWDMAGLLARLEGMADERYRAFNEGLIPGAEGTSLGVRMPALRAVAREIAREDPRGFLDATLGARVHELNLLHAMALARLPWAERMARLKAFVPTVGNWAVCDALCADLKPPESGLDELADFLAACAASGEEYPTRFALVARMLYYRDPARIDGTFQLYAGFRHEGYYARMGAAWGLSALYFVDRERTLRVLESGALDPFTRGKAVQKAIESRRATDEDRARLRALRRRPEWKGGI